MCILSAKIKSSVFPLREESRKIFFLNFWNPLLLRMPEIAVILDIDRNPFASLAYDYFYLEYASEAQKPAYKGFLFAFRR